MQKGEKNRWPSVCRVRPHPWVELLWTRARKARLVLPQEGRGVVRGVVVPVLYWNMPLLLLLHCLGRGPVPERASRDIRKIFQDWPCSFCSLLLLLPRTPPAFYPEGLALSFQGKTRQFLYWEPKTTRIEPKPNPGAQPTISLAECWLCAIISRPT